MKVAIVHDWLTIYGGAESIIRILHELFPEAPIYTSVYDADNMPEDFRKMDIRPSFLQKMPLAKKKYTSYLQLMPKAFESFDLSEYDLVISSSTCCSKGVKTRDDALHICYCNTPMRYAWDFYDQYVKDMNPLKKAYIGMVMPSIRKWDYKSSDRVNLFIANSNNVAERIKRIYGRDSHVIYPPVRTEMFVPSGKDDGFYLAVSRMVPYKKIDLLAETFTKLNKPLYVIGDGSEYNKVKALSGDCVKLLGRLSDEEVLNYMQSCKAFLFPGEEDFGITPVEAQACGKPVIAFGKGGALETVIDGVTGVHFKEQTVESLSEAVERFERIDFDINSITENAARFSETRFRKELYAYIMESYKSFKNGDVK